MSDANPYKSPASLGPTSTLGAAIPYRAALTVQEARAAFRLAEPIGNRIAIGVIRAFFVVALIYMLGIAAFMAYQDDPNSVRLGLVGALFISIPICATCVRAWINRRRFEHLHQQRRGLFEEVEGEVDATSLTGKHASGEGKTHWSAYCGYRNADDIVVLYHIYPSNFRLWTRSMFANDQHWESFLAIVREKLPRM